MKRFLLSIFATSLVFSLMAYDVPTSVQKKNVLIEEFTGIHCGYCPKAHIICHNLEEFNPGRIFSIAVHSGYYAVPASDQPDYRTTDGDAVDAMLGTTSQGRPCGVINRGTQIIDNTPLTLVLGRSEFGRTSQQIMAEDALVNLLIKATCDASTRILNVTVEGYCTGDMPSDKAYLSLVMTQDNIVGPQNGAGVGDEYVHHSMLRDYLTPVLGDEIAVAKGQYFSKDYTFTLPQSIVAPETQKSVDLLLQDINLLAFVTENGKDNIFNVTSAKPVFTNLDLPLAVELSNTTLASKKYGFNFFEVVLTNKSNETITSAEFEIAINGETQTSTWTGEVAPLAKQIVRIPYVKGEVKNTNSWTITTLKLNEKDAEPTKHSGSFTAPTSATKDVTFTIQTDDNSSENRYRILDADGNLVHDFNFASNTANLYQETISLEANRVYCFEIVDLCVDGIYKGSYKINSSDGKMVEQNYSIPDVGCRTFFETSAITDVESVQQSQLAINFDYVERLISTTELAQISVYTISGTLIETVYASELSISDFASGVYIVVAEAQTQSVVNKIIIK